MEDRTENKLCFLLQLQLAVRTLIMNTKVHHVLILVWIEMLKKTAMSHQYQVLYVLKSAAKLYLYIIIRKINIVAVLRFSLKIFLLN